MSFESEAYNSGVKDCTEFIKKEINGKINQLAFDLQNIEDAFPLQERSDKPIFIEKIKQIRYSIKEIKDLKDRCGL